MKKNPSDSAEIPKNPPRFHMEMDGGARAVSLLACGVRHIEAYSSEMITLKIPGGRMYLSGLGLRLTIFENKTVEIGGKLLEVKLSYDRN